jgi:hypothetical protein
MAESGAESIQPAAPSDADRLRVFISYARNDAGDFAEYLVVALKLAGFDAYFDRHDIAKGEDWEARLGDLIAKSDTVVFVITPASVQSIRCGWEVKHTLSLRKRLVPVQWIAVPEADVPIELKRLNYTIFASGQPFGEPLGELAETLRQDLVWLRQQTQIGEQAARWHARRRDSDLLLRGTALVDAREWMQRRKPGAPEISPLINAFVGVSEEAEAAHRSEVRKQLEDREKLVADAELAQKARAEALAEAERATAEKLRRTVMGIVAAVVLVIIAGALGVYAWNQQQLAKAQADIAKQQADFARQETKRADQMIDLVSVNPAGQRAMQKICREAIDVTAMLSTTSNPQQHKQAQDRFWELYFAPMYIIELHQTKNQRGTSTIEMAMVDFGDRLEGMLKDRERLPFSALCSRAKRVRDECVTYLKMSAPESPTCPE